VSLNIGLLCETSHDTAFYRGVIEKILRAEGFTGELRFFEETAGTSIRKKHREVTLYYFSKGIVHFAVYITDYDDGGIKKEMTDWHLENQRSGKNYPIVFSFPNPHMEQWLCFEQDALKHLFGLSFTEAVTCDPNPKAFVQKKMEEAEGYRIKEEYYQELGELVSLQKLEQHADVKKLRQDIKSILNTLPDNVKQQTLPFTE